mgnify:CR=1 FL=1
MEQTEITKTYTVTKEMLADQSGSGTLPVLATPVLAGLFEGAATELAQGYEPEGCTTVGTMILVRHDAPTPCGASVTIRAELTGREGRTFTFRLSAKDDAGPVASGEHTRVSVKSGRFVEKAEGRKSAAHAK